MKRIVRSSTFMSALLVAMPSLASTATETPVRVTARLDEWKPAISPSHLAWVQSRRTARKDFDVFAQPVSGRARQINKKKTDAIMGGLDGSRLVYQEIPAEGDSDLRLVDLATGSRRSLPKGVNTKHDERAPSISGDYLLFARQRVGGKFKAVLWLVQLSTGDRRILDSIGNRREILAPGQVLGDFATWHKCGVGGPCDVYRYSISTGTTAVAPNPQGRLQYTPGVAMDGTVYYVASGFGCGTDVFLMKWTGAGDAAVVVDHPPEVDVTNVFVYEGGGTREIHFAKYDCRPKPASSDLYKLVE